MKVKVNKKTAAKLWMVCNILNHKMVSPREAKPINLLSQVSYSNIPLNKIYKELGGIVK